jgi:hypothetical protein
MLPSPAATDTSPLSTAKAHTETGMPKYCGRVLVVMAMFLIVGTSFGASGAGLAGPLCAVSCGVRENYRAPVVSGKRFSGYVAKFF